MHHPKFNFNLNYDQESLWSWPFTQKKERKSAKKKGEKRPVVWTTRSSDKNGVICPLVIRLSQERQVSVWCGTRRKFIWVSQQGCPASLGESPWWKNGYHPYGFPSLLVHLWNKIYHKPFVVIIFFCKNSHIFVFTGIVLTENFKKKRTWRKVSSSTHNLPSRTSWLNCIVCEYRDKLPSEEGMICLLKWYTCPQLKFRL